jgi:peptide subunit release factor 1 (eRF1)
MTPNEVTLERYPALSFSSDTFDRVASLRAPEAGLLSAYLNVEPAQTQREGFEAALLDLWKPLRAGMKDTDLSARLEEEIERANAYVRSWDVPPGRSVAMFTSAPADVFIAVTLPVPVLAGARFTARPYLLPLLAALDEHERYCVALVDRERARIMTVWMGRVESRAEFTDDLPGRVTRGGGWSTGGRASSRPGMARGIVHSDQGG